MAVERKEATVVSLDYDLNELKVGEKVFLRHEADNEFDKNAVLAIRAEDMSTLGYVSASPHTTLSGCVKNTDLVNHIPSKDIPLVAEVISNTEAVSFKNGTIAPVVRVQVHVVIQSQAV